MGSLCVFLIIVFSILVSPYANANEIGKIDDSDMVYVPAGNCIVGLSIKGFPIENLRSQKTIFVPAFQIDKFEVTNDKYRKFLQWTAIYGDATVRHPNQPADKDHIPRYWKTYIPHLLDTIGISKLQHFKQDTFTVNDHPVVGVDWYDAYAYCKWLGKRIPKEDEWEKAARGTDGRLWPWGDVWDFSKCNSGGYEWKGERDGYIYTAPHNAYAEGVSIYGCYNMAGNVQEWTDEKYIKGGGFNSYPTWVTLFVRQSYEPGFRYFSLGFRCAR
jgi:formylglycine-generating enzyme required for sulfatase activity